MNAILNHNVEKLPGAVFLERDTSRVAGQEIRAAGAGLVPSPRGLLGTVQDAALTIFVGLVLSSILAMSALMLYAIGVVVYWGLLSHR